MFFNRLYKLHLRVQIAMIFKKEKQTDTQYFKIQKISKLPKVFTTHYQWRRVNL